MQKLNKILKITKSIKSLYEKLYNLEINHEENTEEFQIVINKIKELSNLEKSMLSSLSLEEIKKYIDFLEQNYSIVSQKSILESMVLLDSESLTYIRVYNELKSLMMYNPDYIKNIIDATKTSSDDIMKSTSIGKSIHNAYEKDLMVGFLSFIKTYMDNSETRHLKNDFIKAKYNAVFVNAVFEEDAYEYNFSLPENDIYLCSELVCDYNEVPIEIMNQNYIEFFIIVLSSMSALLLSFHDKDLFDKQKFASITLIQAMIRSSFLSLPEDIINNFEGTINLFMNSPVYLASHQGEDVIRNLLTRCFKQSIDDKNRVNKVSFIK